MTTSQPSSPHSLLDQPAVVALRLNWEKIAWIALLLAALILRLYDVGARTMSHDESLHTTYSHHLYKGIGYQHDPLMHGPALFVITAASYFLFGPSDFSARLPVVFLGVGIVGLMWFARGWLSRQGAFLAACLLAFSPALLYHSRYIRHDLYLIFAMVAIVILMFRYLEDGKAKWLLWLAAALGFAHTTMEASFIYAIIFVAFLAAWVLVRLLLDTWQQPANKRAFLITLVIAGAFSVYPLVEAIKAPVGAPVTSARFGGLVMWPVFVLGLVSLLASLTLLWRGYGEQRLRAMREIDVMVWIMTLSAPLYAAFPIKLFGGNPQDVRIVSNMLQPELVTSAVVFFGMVLFFGGLGFIWGRQRYLVGTAIYYAIMVVLFTTFFTNGNGVGTGLVGSVGYWLAQQEVRRGGQPWFYYFMLVPLYEFVPLLLSIGGMVALAWRGLRRQALDPTAEAGGQRSEVRGRKSEVGAQGLRPAPTNPSVGAQALRPDGLRPEGFQPAPRALREQWLLLLACYILGVWAVFTWAGEKMPWLITHFTTPMSILGGWYLAERLKLVNWAQVRSQGGLWFMLGLPVWLLAVINLLRLRPFRGADLGGLSDTMSWLAALALVLGLGYFLARRALALNLDTARRLVFLSLMVVLALFSLRSAFLFTYVNYDYATEPMVYAHGTPDIKIVVDQLHEISRRTVGEAQLAFAYDNETTWPFEWYFRDFPNKRFFGATPSREFVSEAPVVLVGTGNEEKVRPYLGNQYYRIPYRLIWWPKETYKRLTDGDLQANNEIIRGIPLLLRWMRDPQAMRNFWDVIMYRRYQQPVAEWDPSTRFYMFIRKDIAAQVWDLGAAPAVVAEVLRDPFEDKYRLQPAMQMLGSGPGSAPGQLQQPRNLAIAPDGRVYVADSANHRIAVFQADGAFAFQWGSFGEAQGQFNEPWGIAVGEDGRVYVADTWNHRIQVFDSEGQFLNSWGGFVSTGGQLGELGVFWGPRAVAIDANGNLLVTDTGNKRVQIFSPDGQGLTQFGGGGIDIGRFEEPVGVAVGPDGSVYVADTWNRRVQKFDPNYLYVREWPVPGWEGEGIFNKPYLAVDSLGAVYASDPTGWRVMVWNSDGEPLAVLGQYGFGSTDFGFTNGIAIDDDDALWVVDAENHRVMKFDPVR